MLKTTLIFLFATIALISCQQDSGDAQYMNEIVKHRTQKDSLLRFGEKAPFRKNPNFSGLNYFDPNPEFKIKAKATYFPNPEPVQMASTTNRKPVYLKWVEYQFNINLQELKLTGYIHPEHTEEVFIPFRDLTNGASTYGGGRYLNLPIHTEDSVWLDFNKCYHPYCHYDTGYSCPLVPVENKLEVSIPAGEKKYK